MTNVLNSTNVCVIGHTDICRGLGICDYLLNVSGSPTVSHPTGGRTSVKHYLYSFKKHILYRITGGTPRSVRVANVAPSSHLRYVQHNIADRDKRIRNDAVLVDAAQDIRQR